MKRVLGILLLASGILIPPPLLAHEGHRHVLGTVTAVDATHVEIRAKDGKAISVPISAGAKYYKGSTGRIPGAASGLKVGTRVVIDLAKDGTASEVRLPSGKTASSHKM